MNASGWPCFFFLFFFSKTCRGRFDLTAKCPSKRIRVTTTVCVHIHNTWKFKIPRPFTSHLTHHTYVSAPLAVHTVSTSLSRLVLRFVSLDASSFFFTCMHRIEIWFSGYYVEQLVLEKWSLQHVYRVGVVKWYLCGGITYAVSLPRLSRGDGTHD